jgi:hypothetical protein
VLLACEARFLSGVLWRSAPLESLRLLLRARRSGALSNQQVILLFCRNVLPQQFYHAARHMLDALRQSLGRSDRSAAFSEKRA